MRYIRETKYNMRHQLSEERGFFFPNDGWWRSKEPNIRQRSEACIASASLREAYNGNIHYWHEEKNDLLRRYVSKYNFNAYQFYQRDEIRSVINTYNSKLRVRMIMTKYMQLLHNLGIPFVKFYYYIIKK